MAGSADGRLWRLRSKTVADNGTIVLILEGRLTHATAPELKAIAAAEADPAKNLVIDLSSVDYLSSAALKVVAELAAELADRGRVLTLRSPSPAARLSLELAGLNEMVR